MRALVCCHDHRERPERTGGMKLACRRWLGKAGERGLAVFLSFSGLFLKQALE
jgi:hypothetical protein